MNQDLPLVFLLLYLCLDEWYVYLYIEDLRFTREGDEKKVVKKQVLNQVGHVGDECIYGIFIMYIVYHVYISNMEWVWLSKFRFQDGN